MTQSHLAGFVSKVGSRVPNLISEALISNLKLSLNYMIKYAHINSIWTLHSQLSGLTLLEKAAIKKIKQLKLISLLILLEKAANKIVIKINFN